MLVTAIVVLVSSAEFRQEKADYTERHQNAFMALQKWGHDNCFLLRIASTALQVLSLA